MNRAFKYRLYPTTEQRELFMKTFGCCRKVYNLMLADKIESYKQTGKFAMVTPAIVYMLTGSSGLKQEARLLVAE